MSKRHLEDDHTPASRPKRPKHQRLALLQYMLDPKHVVKTGDKVIVLREMYPKAKIHYLAVPYESIPDIYHLNRNHIDLLKEFGELYKQIRDETNCSLKAGFFPSSDITFPQSLPLHMHIISTDFISPYMTTRVQWNKYTTPFFVPYDDVLNEVKKRGSVKRMTKIQQRNCISKGLKCNQCSCRPATMAQLMRHLLTHRPHTEALELEAGLDLSNRPDLSTSQ